MKHFFFIIALILQSFSIVICEEDWYTEKWKTCDYLKNIDFKAIDCYDSSNCMAVGIRNFFFPYFRETTDWGKTWETVSLDTAINWKDSSGIYHQYWPTRVNDIAFPSPNVCIAACDSGLVMKSTDRGKTWKKNYILNKDIPLNKIIMANEKIGYLACRNSSLYSKLLLTEDCGENWIPLDINIPNIDYTAIINFAIPDTDAIRLIIYNDGIKYFISSDDRGKSWQYCSDLIMGNSCYFIDRLSGWVVGGIRVSAEKNIYSVIIQNTIDGGMNWNTQLDSVLDEGRTLSDIYFFDMNNGIAITYGQTILRTFDGGLHWSNQTDKLLQYKHLNSLFTDIAFNSLNHPLVTGITERIFMYDENHTSVANNSNDKLGFSIFPSPAHSGEAIHINFSLPESGTLKIELFDLLGNKIAPVTNEFYESGSHDINYTLTSLSAGVYYIKLTMKNKIVNYPLIIIK